MRRSALLSVVFLVLAGCGGGGGSNDNNASTTHSVRSFSPATFSASINVLDQGLTVFLDHPRAVNQVQVSASLSDGTRTFQAEAVSTTAPVTSSGEVILQFQHLEKGVYHLSIYDADTTPITTYANGTAFPDVTVTD